MQKRLSVYSTHTEKQEYRIYDGDLRTLFGLPKRNGKFTLVWFGTENSSLNIVFESTRRKRQDKTVIS